MLNFNNMNNVEDAHEFLEDPNVMNDFREGEETQNLKDYLLALKACNGKLFIAIEKGSGKMSDSLLVIVAPKEKLAARKWIHAVCGKEATVKDKK